MSIRLQRFDFSNLRDFRGPLVVEETPEAVVEEEIYVPPPPTFSEEELVAAKMDARQEGYAEGFEAGLARAAQQADAQKAAVDTTILNLGQQVQDIQRSYQHLITEESKALSDLVKLIAQKIAGESLDAHVGDTALALVERCLPVILSKPRLIVDLHPSAFEAAIGRIEALLQTSGYEGEIQFRTNPALGAHDATLDWGAGGAHRSTATLWQEIESLLGQMPVTLAPLGDHAHIMNNQETTPNV